MKAVVVAAGEGTRMRPLTATRPKPLLPVAGRALLDRVLDACAPVVDGVVVVVGYEAAAVREHVGSEHAGTPVEYVEQAEQLGTGHAIAQAAPLVEEPFLALNGDVVVADRLVADLAAAEGTAMAVKPVEDPSSYGVVALESDRVTAIEEKPADPPTDLANLGIYRFEPSVFDRLDALELSPRGEYEVTDALAGIVAGGDPVTAVEYDGVWLDVGRPWELLDATEHLLADGERRLDGDVADGATVEGAVVVEDGARVRAGTSLEGPVLVQSGGDVGPNAYVRHGAVVGPDARVGNASEVKNSILMAGAAVPHHGYVGDSVLGREVNLGAGTKVANLRHDGANVRMNVKGEAVDTGRRKLGVVAADGVKTGINTSLNAGVKLGPGATTLPGETVLADRDGE